MARKNHRLERINSDLKRELSLLIANDVLDPAVQDVDITVTSVQSTQDMKEAKVLVNIQADNEDTRQEALKALQRASGFLRTQLSNVFSTYTVPFLRFILDHSQEYLDRIEEILTELKENNEISSEISEDFGKET